MSKAAQSKIENHAIAKACRNTIAKSSLDISELNIACSGSTVEIWGRVRPPRGAGGTLNMKKELEHIKELLLTVRGVREVNSQRVVLAEM
jgi:hypothetical protein